MKLKLLLALSLLFALGLAGAAEEHTVEMKNMGADGSMVFEPAVIKVAVGDTVNFVLIDQLHNSESVEGLTPEGSVTWQGGMNQNISVTLDKEGVYVYQCTPHVMLGMVGVIVAGEPVNLEAIKSDSKALSGMFVMNKDRLDKYLSQVE